MNLSLPKFGLMPSKSDAKSESKPKTKDQSAGKRASNITDQAPLISMGQVFEPLLAVSLLVTVVIISSLAVIYTAYDYRRLFHQHQTLVRESDNYRIEWGQLLIEQSTWGSNSRVEKVAAESMDMRAPSNTEIRLIRHE